MPLDSGAAERPGVGGSLPVKGTLVARPLFPRGRAGPPQDIVMATILLVGLTAEMALGIPCRSHDDR